MKVMNKTKSFTWVLFLFLFLYAASSFSEARYINEADYSGPIRIACVGDSITYGYGINDRTRNSYPAQLAGLLGPKWQVHNFGVSGATLLKKGNFPYWEQDAFMSAREFKPQVVIIMLGTNDARRINWKHKDEYVDDYIALIKSFQKLDTKPEIWLCYPAPAYSLKWGINNTIKGEIIPRIGEVALQTFLPIIDLYQALSNRKEMFSDSLHPNSNGAKLIAEKIFSAITGAKVQSSSECLSVMESR